MLFLVPPDNWCWIDNGPLSCRTMPQRKCWSSEKRSPSVDSFLLPQVFGLRRAQYDSIVGCTHCSYGWEFSQQRTTTICLDGDKNQKLHQIRLCYYTHAIYLLINYAKRLYKDVSTAPTTWLILYHPPDCSSMQSIWSWSSSSNILGVWSGSIRSPSKRKRSELDWTPFLCA